MKVLYFLRDNGGCGWYRCASPLDTAGRHKDFEVSRIEKGDRESDIAEKIAWADVCVVPRVFDEKFVPVIGGFKEMGKKVVIDWDDNIFRVSPLSPHYKDFGTENYVHNHPSGSLDVWIDGKNIDLKRNAEGLERARKALGMADMVTATTDILADVFRSFNHNVRVLPNCIDLNIWKKLNFQSHRTIRMGWSGGYSHYEDWIIMAQVLPEFMKAHPNVTLVLLGQKFEGTLKGIDPERIEYQGWCPTPAYPYVSAIMDLDFALIPLVNSEFNNCKSSIKWLEMAALSVPSVTSYCSPYAEMMDLVKENGIFVEKNDYQAWFDALSLMTKNHLMRRNMGFAARKTVEDYFDIGKQCHLWKEAYESLFKPVLEVV